MQTPLEIQDSSSPSIQHEQRTGDEQYMREQMIIDVRTPGEFEAVHIPGSRNIPLTDLERYLSELGEIAKGCELTLVCRTQNRVMLAYDQLVMHGISNCRILEGGVNQWMAEGKPLVRGRKSISLEGQVRMAAGTFIVVGILLSVLLSPWLLVIPVAVGTGLIHAGWTDSCLMGMVLGKLSFNRMK